MSSKASKAGTVVGRGDSKVQDPQQNIHMLREDSLSALLQFLAVDDLFAFSLTCVRFNATRKNHGRVLRTSLAWALSSPSVSAWSESIGCPSPYPHWAELRSLQKEKYNGLIVKVVRKPNRGRQLVHLHSSLSSPEMQRCAPGLRAHTVEGPDDAGTDGLAKATLVRTANIRVLQPKEISRAKIIFYSEEFLAPGQTRTVSGLAAHFVQVAAQLNLGEAQLGRVLCSKAVLGLVGGDMRLVEGLTGPRMCGVEVSVRATAKTNDNANKTSSTPLDDNTTVELLGGRAFEILEILNGDYYGHPSLRDTLLGKARLFHARVRWISQLPPRHPLSLPAEVMTRSFF